MRVGCGGGTVQHYPDRLQQFSRLTLTLPRRVKNLNDRGGIFPPPPPGN